LFLSETNASKRSIVFAYLFQPDLRPSSNVAEKYALDKESEVGVSYAFDRNTSIQPSEALESTPAPQDNLSNQTGNWTYVYLSFKEAKERNPIKSDEDHLSPVGTIPQILQTRERGSFRTLKQNGSNQIHDTDIRFFSTKCNTSKAEIPVSVTKFPSFLVKNELSRLKMFSQVSPLSDSDFHSRLIPLDDEDSKETDELTAEQAAYSKAKLNLHKDTQETNRTLRKHYLTALLLQARMNLLEGQGLDFEEHPKQVYSQYDIVVCIPHLHIAGLTFLDRENLTILQRPKP
jgi:hypothetical protein